MRSENEGSFVLPLTFLIPEEPPSLLVIAWGLPEDRLGIGVPKALVDRLGAVWRSVIETATWWRPSHGTVADHFRGRGSHQGIAWWMQGLLQSVTSSISWMAKVEHVEGQKSTAGGCTIEVWRI